MGAALVQGTPGRSARACNCARAPGSRCWNPLGRRIPDPILFASGVADACCRRSPSPASTARGGEMAGVRHARRVERGTHLPFDYLVLPAERQLEGYRDLS